MVRLRRVALVKPSGSSSRGAFRGGRASKHERLPRREATSSTPEVSAGHRAAALVRRARPRVKRGSLASVLQWATLGAKDRRGAAGAIAAFVNEYFSARRGTVGLAVDGCTEIAKRQARTTRSCEALRTPSDVYLDSWMRGSKPLSLSA